MAPACSPPVDVSRLSLDIASKTLSVGYGCGSASSTAVKSSEPVVGAARDLGSPMDRRAGGCCGRMPRPPRVRSGEKASKPWSGPPSQVVSEMVQRAWDGALFKLRGHDGSRQEYVVSGTSWEAFEKTT